MHVLLVVLCKQFHGADENVAGLCVMAQSAACMNTVVVGGLWVDGIQRLNLLTSSTLLGFVRDYCRCGLHGRSVQ